VAFLFQRGKKRTWWIKYYVHGKQVYHSLGTTNARAAERIRRQIEGEEARGDLIAPSRTPLPAFLEQFCQFLKTVRTRKSFKNDYSVLRVFFGPICPALMLGARVNHRCATASRDRCPTLTRPSHLAPPNRLGGPGMRF